MGDLRFALRTLRKNAGYATVAVATLAIAVGAATAIFSVMNSVLLKPLPYRDPDRLVVIRDQWLPRFPEFSVAPGRFVEWQRRTHVFETIAVSQNTSVNLTDGGDPLRVVAAVVSPTFFPLAGVAPIAGRTFRADEDSETPLDLMVLSEGFWRSRFGADRDIVGKTIHINGRVTTVVGVMPGSFVLPNTATQAWVLMALSGRERTLYGSHYLACYGRLKPGVTIDQARADIAQAAASLAKDQPNEAGWTALVFPMLEFGVRGVRTGILVLAAAVGGVLLIACANVANLLLARGAGRQREFSVRAALGATSGRLVRQLLIENLTIGVIGSVAGVLLGWGLLSLLMTEVRASLPRSQAIGLDSPTLLFGLGLAIVTPILFGILPALQMSRVDLGAALAHGGRSSGTTLRARTRAMLIIAEVALAVMLVAGSTLLLRSFSRLSAVDPGFTPAHALALGVSLPSSKYGSDDLREQFWQKFIERAGSLPSVEAAGLTQSVPLDSDFVSGFEVNEPAPDQNQRPSANFYSVTPEYFRAMNIPLIRGRSIAASDGPNTPRVSVISKSLADRYFPGVDPIGRKIRIGQGPSRDFGEIIGVVGDIKQYGLDRETTLQIYEPVRQHRYFGSLVLVLRSNRSAGSTDALTASVRNLVKELDPTLPIATPRTLQSLVDTSVGSQRLTTELLALFGAIALLLAAIGVYGVVSFTVGQRTQEIGVRLALGAQRRSILALVFGQGLGLTAIGIVIGAVGALWAGQLIQSQLFQVSQHDPVAFLAAPAVLFAAAALACFWPARRALKVNPVSALRQQ